MAEPIDINYLTYKLEVGRDPISSRRPGTDPLGILSRRPGTAL